VLNFSTEYKFSLAKETELNLTNTAASIAPFAIKAPDGRPLVRLERLDVSETTVDLAKQQVVIGKIRSNKLETWAAREADGQLDWQKLFASQPSKPSKAPEPAKAPATADSPKAIRQRRANPGKCCSRTCNCATIRCTWPTARPNRPWHWNWAR
jgi:uncharacterized protein involved in outer membrane biogenesis